MAFFRRFRGMIGRQAGFRRVLAHQLLLAGLFTLLAFAFAIVFNASMSYMGNEDPAAAAFVLKNFWHAILLTQFKIILVYLVGFALLGTVAALLLHALWYVAGWRSAGARYRAALFGAPILLYLHWFGYSVLSWPAAYSRTLFEKGGMRRVLQIFLTDGPGPGYYTAALVFLLLAAAVLGVLVVRKLVREGRGAALRQGGERLLARIRRRRLAAAVPVLLAAGLAVYAAVPAGAPARVPQQKNLLIIAADALRPDRLSLNGYGRRTTPNLDRYFARGTSFDNIHAEVPRTFPAWVTMLSSQYSLTHGIRHMFPRREERARSFPSLMHLLQKAGYRTGVVSDFAGDIFPRIDLGFQRVQAPRFTFDDLLTQGNLEIHTLLFPFLLNGAGRALFPVLREFAQLPDGGLLARETIGMIRDFSREGPFAVTLFLSTTHFPYANRHPWYKKFTDPAYRGEYKYYKQQVVMQGGQDVNAADIRQVNDLYDGGVAAADAAAGEVLRYLEQSGLLKHTVVVLLADHGENLYEEGMGMGHGEHLRGCWATRIPFVVAVPEAPHPVLNRVAGLGSAVDITPTLASLLGMPRHEKWEGRDLSWHVTGRGNRPGPGTAYSETGIWFSDRGDHFFQKQRIMYPDIVRLSEVDFKNNREVVLRGEGYPGVVVLAKHRAWREGRYKLIYIPLRDGIRWELYDTVADPHNRHNLVERLPAVAASMKEKLIKFCSAPGRDAHVNGYFFPDR